MKNMTLEKDQGMVRGKMLIEKVPEEAQAMRLSDKNSTQVVWNAVKNLLNS